MIITECKQDKITEGTVVEINSTEILRVDDLISVVFEDMYLYFVIYSINVDATLYKCSAKQVGSANNLYDMRYDLRRIIGKRPIVLLGVDKSPELLEELGI